jgi:dienelactone hydrolase
MLPITFLFFVNCTSKEAVNDLSDGRSGKIYFQSENSTFKKRFDGNSAIEKVKIYGDLTLPKVKADKTPAAILLHGVGGVTDDIPKDHITKLAKNLNDIGLATFIIDSQTPRDARMTSDVLKIVSLSMRVADAYAALNLLSTHPKIDRKRIGVVGISRGGNVALLAQSKIVRDCYVKDPKLKFSAVLLLYPLCHLRPQEWDMVESPILMLLGEDDNITPAVTSMKVAERLIENNIDVKVTVYEDTYHAFDFDFVSGKKIEWFLDLSGCQDRHIILEKDGMIYSPFYNNRVDDERNANRNFTECSQNKPGYLGGAKESKAKAMKEYKQFFKAVYSL